ncbi:MAG: metal-dependent hydrolase, partial [Rhodoferax sp.]
MHPLLQFTLDFFEPNQPLGHVPSSQAAINKVAFNPTDPAGQIALKVDAELGVPPFSHPRANRATHLGGWRVAFEFKRGQRRTIGFSVS